MVRIVLVRHASTTWSGVRYCGTSDPPLSEEGVADAARLAAELGPRLPPGTRIASSPSRRTVATASAIAEVAGIPGIELDDRWREADFGLAEGRTFDELRAVAPDLADALAGGVLAVDWPGGETHGSLATRVARAWLDVLADGRPTVVVTHAGPLMHARALAEDRPPRSDDLIGPGTAVTIDVAGTSGRPVLPSRA